ncbi:MAG: tetratricopeptide repeat protein [Thermoanaerobaculales bacterium]|nr:tetratricopeptide repeat protein [Thermoanaerobaculales bacterium]
MRLLIRFVLCLSFVATLGVAIEAHAQVGRITGVVMDQDGNALEGVTLTVTTEERMDFEMVKKTNKKGIFLLSFMEATLGYVCEIKMEGYQTMVVPLDPIPGGSHREEFTLLPPAAEEQVAAQKAALSGAGRAVIAYNEGVEAQGIGDLDLAAKKYRNALKINPKLGAAHTSLAALAHINEDYVSAAAEAEAALAIDPTDSRAMQLLYDAYRKSGDKVKAEEAAKAMSEMGAVSDSSARIFNEGVQAYQAGDIPAAVDMFQEAANIDPNLVQVRLVLGQIYLSQGKAAEALVVVEEALEVEPENSKALKVKFEAARVVGDQEAAGAALDGLVAADPEWAATGLFDKAVDLYNEGRTDDAAQALEKVLQAKPDHARAHYLYGMTLFNSGKTADAKVHLEEFIRLAPEDPDVAIAAELLKYME